MKYSETYSGRELLKKHNLNEYGIWQVKGEDPNCDFGGHHYQPDLGIYEGTLRDVIEIAVQLSGFWTGGAGGDIIKKNLEKVDKTTSIERRQKRELLTNLEKQVADLKKELGV